MTGGDPAMTIAMLNDFVDTSRGDLRALADAADAHDHDGVRRQAHRIAGASRIVGAADVIALAQRIEHAAAAGSANPDVLRAEVERLDAALEQVAATVPAGRDAALRTPG